jgi:Ni/Fe-hydrogenase subunit HybB-like protein
MLWPLDALLRTNGVTGMVDALSNSKVHPEYKTSLLTPLIVGAVVSSGGGVLVGVISGTTANWSFSTPPFLRQGTSWDVTLDVWGGALVGK